MPVIRKTWGYGTRKKVIIMDANTSVITAIEEETKEGFILAGIRAPRRLSKGEGVTIEFKQGGPTGGYWDIVVEEKV